jgi:glycosyltransferase involved in cell wall biosynthesis
MKETYVNKNIHYLGNVINSLYEVSEEEALQEKGNSCDLLFVGDFKYTEGARALIKAYNNLKRDFVELNLHIIGLKKAEIGEELPEGVLCHGYLDKAKHADRALYYDLFKRAKIFVNTTPKWGGFSATIEAMYFYIPVIVAPYGEFVETFGKEITFGKFCDDNSPTEIERNVRLILNDRAYDDMCVNAHRAVKEFTWSSYVDEVLRKIESTSAELRRVTSDR